LEGAKLLRLIDRHGLNWEKIARGFKDREVDSLKQAWRRYRASMRSELTEIRRIKPNFSQQDWIKLVIRKLEGSKLRKQRAKPDAPAVIDVTQKA
jgi:hypothetical protein